MHNSERERERDEEKEEAVAVREVNHYNPDAINAPSSKWSC